LVENVAMNCYFESPFCRHGTLDYGQIREHTEQLISDYSVAAPGPYVKARNLSGGNLQKLILARVLSRRPRLVIANLPTQGLDVGATEFVLNKLMQAKVDGAAVLLISEDLDEILCLSDRVAPTYEGQFVAILAAEEADPVGVGAMMAGLPWQGNAA
jgi:general nucleoside transport system ATP-binding protein